jgi:dynein heavy chain
MQSMLTNTMPENYDNVVLTFSARTSANQTQDIIDSKMDKRRKGVFGPPTGKSYVICVDDLNMPQREKYFAQPPIELLRQWMDHGGWYERAPPCAFRRIVDSQVKTRCSLRVLRSGGIIMHEIVLLRGHVTQS